MVAGDPPEADGQTAATERVMGKSSDLSFMVHRGFIFEGGGEAPLAPMRN